MNIKANLKSCMFFRYYIERLKWFRYKKIAKRYSDLEYVKKLYAKANNNKELNLNSPQLFTEKLQWLKLFYRDERIPICSNKVTAKEYIAEQGFSDLLVPTLGIYDDPKKIDPSALPEQFIIKGSHGSGWNIIIKEKSEANWYQIRRVCQSWLDQNIYVYGREWNYKDQPRHIIIEPLLKEEAPVDYKVMCFNGKPKAFQVNHCHEGIHYVDLYDDDWNLLSDMGIGIFPHSNIVLEKPEDFERMKQIAKKLSEPFPFVRIDFYNFDNRLYFGEMTFFPGSGFWTISPVERNREFGNWLSLPHANNDSVL